MDLFFNVLKGQFNSLNFILIVLLGGFLASYLNKRKLSGGLFIFVALFFVLTSTTYLPRYLVGRMESVYQPFNRDEFDKQKDTIYIQSLGGGYTSDPRLSPPAQLSWVSLGRLTEAMRIARIFDKGILVLSGNVASGQESMALVAKQAAIQLGFDSTRIVILETPSTTQEEAEAFVHRFGKSVELILVTDAIHMPRAMQFFKAQGIKPIPAPTNYVIKKEESPINTDWIPSIENLQRMDRVWREYLGVLKGKLVSSETSQHCAFYF